MARVRAPRGRVTPRLQALRLARMWHQGELARAAGISPMAVSRAERGGVMGFRTIRALATALEVTPDELCAVAPVETAEAGV